MANMRVPRSILFISLYKVLTSAHMAEFFAKILRSYVCIRSIMKHENIRSKGNPRRLEWLLLKSVQIDSCRGQTNTIVSCLAYGYIILYPTLQVN